jgi:hypothetical protein
MNRELTELILQMEKAVTLDEAVSLQRRALAYTRTATDPKAATVAARAGEAMLKRMMASHAN